MPSTSMPMSASPVKDASRRRRDGERACGTAGIHAEGISRDPLALHQWHSPTNRSCGSHALGGGGAAACDSQRLRRSFTDVEYCQPALRAGRGDPGFQVRAFHFGWPFAWSSSNLSQKRSAMPATNRWRSWPMKFAVIRYESTDSEGWLGSGMFSKG